MILSNMRNNKGADQSARMRSLVCAFVVSKPLKKDFLALRQILEHIQTKTRTHKIKNSIKVKQPSQPNVYNTYLCRLSTCGETAIYKMSVCFLSVVLNIAQHWAFKITSFLLNTSYWADGIGHALNRFMSLAIAFSAI